VGRTTIEAAKRDFAKRVKHSDVLANAHAEVLDPLISDYALRVYQERMGLISMCSCVELPDGRFQVTRVEVYVDSSGEDDIIQRKICVSHVTPQQPEDVHQKDFALSQEADLQMNEDVEEADAVVRPVPEESIMCSVCNLRDAPHSHPVLQLPAHPETITCRGEGNSKTTGVDSTWKERTSY